MAAAVVALVVSAAVLVVAGALRRSRAQIAAGGALALVAGLAPWLLLFV